MGVIEHVYRPRGAIRRLWQCRAPEVLLEGPAGTGKTRGLLEYMNWCCEECPGIRVLMVRKTRASLAESVMVEYEQSVLRPDHPSMRRPVTRNHREFYAYENGSHVVPAGMDQPTKTFSTQYDLILYFEAIEGNLDEWEKLLRANRNGRLPWQQAIADTNPGPAHHFLNRRALSGKMVRLKSTHKDNPVLWDEEKGDWTDFGRDYIEKKLGWMSGANRARLLLGEWVSDSGLVWPQYNPLVHDVRPDDPRLERLQWYFGAMDFGYNAPGCLGVYGVDEEDRMFMVAEVYRRGWTIDRWADVIEEIYHEYPLHAVIADCADPASIQYLNDQLTPLCGRHVRRLVRPAKKSEKRKRGSVLRGMEQVRYALEGGPEGAPKLFFVDKEARMRCGVDPELDMKGLPTCTTEEMLSYHFKEPDPDRPDEEGPDPGCPDHGCDQLRYAVTWKWKKDLRPKVEARAVPGTWQYEISRSPILRKTRYDRWWDRYLGAG